MVIVAALSTLCCLSACSSTTDGTPTSATTSATLGGPRAGFEPELLGQELGGLEVTEPRLATLWAAADYTDYLGRHSGMGLPEVDSVDLGRNVVVTVAAVGCGFGPPFVRLDGVRLGGGFEELPNPLVCEAELEHHAAFLLARSMLPND